jgi:large-conductance mechanosensitive channel
MSSGITNQISSLKKFITTNNIVGTCAGVSIGLAAKDSITSLVEDVLGPLTIIFLHGLNIDWLTNYLPINGHSELNIFKFIKNLSTFFFIIIMSFIFVYFAFGYLLGVDTLGDSDKTTASSGTSAASLSLPPPNKNKSNNSSADLFTTIGGLNGSTYSLKESFENYLAYSN